MRKRFSTPATLTLSLTALMIFVGAWNVYNDARNRAGLAASQEPLEKSRLPSQRQGQTQNQRHGYVRDDDELLDVGTEEHLTTSLRQLEADTTSEVAVVTVSRLDGKSIEEYASTLFKELGVGQEAQHNGVLVLVCAYERRARIEVGAGLEAILPNSLANDVVRRQFMPRFRRSDFSGGIRDGVARLAEIIRAKRVATPEERRAWEATDAKEAAETRRGELILFPFLGIFVTVGSIALGVGVRTRSLGVILSGLVMGGIPFAIAALLIPHWTWPWLPPFSLVMISIGVMKGGSSRG